MTSFIRRLLVVLAVLTFVLLSLIVTGAINLSFSDDDPDLPKYRVTSGELSKEEFMTRRAEGIALKRGISKDTPFDPQVRQAAIRQMGLQEEGVARMRQSNIKNSLLAAWTPLGPAPIPNGQTLTVSTPVSGRTISIAVHPTNPNIVYVGAAQGGLYRSTDGGTNWTPLMDNALSLAIGAIAIAPSQPDTIYVGTGETGFCGDCFFGVGVYRIDNASTASPVISGPFNDDPTDVDIFTGRGIGAIAVHPTLPGTIFVASGSGIGGSGGVANNVLPNRGLYRSTDATSADPTFTKMVMTGPASVNNATVDVVIDPGNPDLVLCTLADALNAGDGGVYRSINALAPVPAFARTFTAGVGVTLSRTELALHRSGLGVVTVYAASGFNGGTVQRSIDGGATWAQRIDNNFCTPQCFYDIGVAVDPTNADNVYIGGAPALAFGRSVNGGTSFTNNAATAVGLHVDSHAIAVAPSLPTTIYFGSDGGIYKTTNSGTNWTPLNNTQYSATQFVSLAVHPIDRYFTIGGTQDNGTNFFQPSQLWTNTEGGDGGFTQIDQNAVNNTAVTMYHTFFNQTNAMGYSRSTNAGNSWQFFGCGFGGATPNGMTCAVPAGGILFYAPMERGPGNPNTLYFGSNVLYRSANAGTTMVKVSQEGTMGGAISAIGISPQNDNVRILGTSTGGIFGTTTGANPLLNLDALGQIPNNFVGRAVVDPNNVNTAYVTLQVFGVNNVWKTIDLNSVNPTWTAMVSGLPQVPVSAFVIDPQDSNALYAGTDIGVYQSLDGGTSWLPFGTGLPRVAVFDVEISNVHRILRIATHGRGLYEINIPGVGLPVPVAAGDGTSGPGGASAIVAETCTPNNGAIDPGEAVTVSYGIQNVGGGPTTNLVATLQATGGVTAPSGPQNYGVIAPGGTVTRNFTFTAAGACGGTITLTFQLQDGATNYGTVSVTYVLGALVFSPATFTQNFDGVVAPALPAGWTTAQTGTAPLWATTTSFSHTAPNSAATDGSANPGDNSLTSPTIAIPAAPVMGTNPTVQLSFRNNYNTEGGFDGGVLEISINGGVFADIITAGGSFAAGGYNGAIGVTDSVLTGRQAWTGNSNGFITTIVNLPPLSFSQNAQLRWRTAYDTGTNPAGGGMRVDTISIYAVTRICCVTLPCTITCPANITAGNDPNQCGKVVTYPAPTMGGTCGTVSCSPASGSFFSIGTTTVTCNATGAPMPSCSFTVTVTNPAPVLSYNAQTVTAGTTPLINPATGPSDNNGPITLVLQSVVPANGLTVSLNSATGQVQVTSATTIGNYVVTIVATDNCGATTVATLAVNVACPAVTLPPSLPNGVQSTAYSQSVAVSPANANYTYAVTTNVLPPGLTLNATTGAITGTPTAPGNYAFNVTATGFGVCTVTRSYNLLVTGTCETITVNPATLPNGTLGAAYPAASVSATGGTAPHTFAVTQGVLPTGLALNATTGAITGTPTAAGTFSFRVTATAVGGCLGSRQYVVSVACAALTFSPAGPALPNGAKNVAYNQAITVAPAASYTFSLLLGSLPPGYTLSPAGVLSGITSQSGTFNFTVKALTGSCQGTKAYTLTIPNPPLALALAQMNDYDGDGKSDPALLAANGEWRIQLSSNQTAQAQLWGTAGDVPLSGDYDGDGKTDLAVFRPSTGTWYIKRSSDGGFLSKAWGLRTDVPVPGDYDGDGKTDIAVWRGAEGNWYILYSGRSSDGMIDTVTWGASYAPYNDVPVQGDYDGDGKTDIGVFRRATGMWYVRQSGSGNLLARQWGMGTDVPVAGDYDGDGKADVAVWRGSSGTWYIQSSATGAVRTQAWGAGYAPYNDQAVPGDYDGDGQADLAVWRAADATWYLSLSGVDQASNTRAVRLGESSDRPVSARQP